MSADHIYWYSLEREEETKEQHRQQELEVYMDRLGTIEEYAKAIATTTLFSIGTYKAIVELAKIHGAHNLLQEETQVKEREALIGNTNVVINVLHDYLGEVSGMNIDGNSKTKACMTITQYICDVSACVVELEKELNIEPVI